MSKRSAPYPQSVVQIYAESAFLCGYQLADWRASVTFCADVTCGPKFNSLICERWLSGATPFNVVISAGLLAIRKDLELSNIFTGQKIRQVIFGAPVKQSFVSVRGVHDQVEFELCSLTRTSSHGTVEPLTDQLTFDFKSLVWSYDFTSF